MPINYREAKLYLPNSEKVSLLKPSEAGAYEEFDGVKIEFDANIGGLDTIISVSTEYNVPQELLCPKKLIANKIIKPVKDLILDELRGCEKSLTRINKLAEKGMHRSDILWKPTRALAVKMYDMSSDDFKQSESALYKVYSVQHTNMSDWPPDISRKLFKDIECVRTDANRFVSGKGVSGALENYVAICEMGAESEPLNKVYELIRDGKISVIRD